MTHEQKYLHCLGVLRGFLSIWVSKRYPDALLAIDTGELGYIRPLYDRFLHMMDNMPGPSPMHIKYSSYVYNGFCIHMTDQFSWSH